MYIKQNLLSGISFIFILMLIFSSCGPETPELENDEELITTLNLNFRNTETGETVVFKLFDEDGNGPKAPVYTNPTLSPDASYVVEVEVLNELANPTEEITAEILEEGDAHQFFYQISNGLDLEFAYDDTDVNNFPIGLRALFFTGVESSGTMTVTLKHEPDKESEGAKDGLIDNVGGETDIQAIFNVIIE